MINGKDLYKEAKFTSRDAVRHAQTVMLRKHLLYAKEHSPTYRKILAEIDLRFPWLGLAEHEHRHRIQRAKEI